MSLDVLRKPPAKAEGWDINEPMNRVMIFATLYIGWGEISEENHLKWFARLRAYETLVGPVAVYGDADKKFIELETVREYIGLMTNVGYVPDFEFAERIYRSTVEGIVRRLRREGVDTSGMSTPDVERVLMTFVMNDEEDEEGLDPDAQPTYHMKLYVNGEKYDEVFNASVQDDDLEPHIAIRDLLSTFMWKRYGN